MRHADDYEAQVLGALTRAVTEALDRKRRLGQYYVVWRDGRPVCIGPDAPAESDSYHDEGAQVPGGVKEPAVDD